MYKNDSSSDPETMSAKLEFQSVPYLTEDDCNVYFKCSTEYVPGSSYAVCYTDSMKVEIEDFVSQLSGN